MRRLLGRAMARSAGPRKWVWALSASLSVRTRPPATGGGRKSDDADPLSVAHVALHRTDVPQVTAEEPDHHLAAAGRTA